MDKVVVKLVQPIEVGGKKVTELTMREPTVADNLEMVRRCQTPEEQEVFLVGTLTGVGAGVISKMTLREYWPLQKALSGFFPGTSSETAENSGKPSR